VQRINGITDNPYQNLTLTVGENETCNVKLYFAPTQYAWYFDWEYKDIVSKGNKITLTPNALRQFKGRIPFGLYFYSEDNMPPFKIDDWTTRVTFGILSEEEVEQIEHEVFTRG
jgi:hypothetical protein